MTVTSSQMDLMTSETLLLLSVDPECVRQACRFLRLSDDNESAFGCVEDRYRVGETQIIAVRCGVDSMLGNRLLPTWLNEIDTLVYIVPPDTGNQIFRSEEIFFSMIPSLPARVRRVVIISNCREISDHSQAYDRNFLRLDTLEELSDVCRTNQGKQRSDTLETAPSITPFSAR
jgi:hypothetical protein